jgi:hypothetical protein
MLVVMSGACATCGAAIDPNAASYSESGDLICKRCEALQTIHTGDKRAGDAIFGSAIAAFVLGLFSLGCNPFFFASLSAIGAGVGSIATMVRHPEYRKTLGDARWTASWVLSVFGICLGLVYPGLLVLSVLLVGAAGAVR